MFLSEKFLEKYKDKHVPFGPLGYVVYKRTYARFIESENRHEEWWETCRRVVQGNLQLEYDHREEHDLSHSYHKPFHEYQREAESMYDDLFHLKWMPGGRGLWCSGTNIGFKNGASLTNCFFVEIKPHDGKVSTPFVFAMDMLMLGAGVGFSVRKECIDTLPAIANPVDLHIVCSSEHRDYQFLDAGSIPVGTKQEIRLHDSREGWIYGLKKIIDSAFLSKRANLKTLVIDVSDVRPSGELIRSFGGKSSGPAPLVELYRSINGILNNRVGSKLNSVDCTDIMNLIGRCVVAGNVRRSAEIALGDADDMAFVTMKQYDSSGLAEFKDKLANLPLSSINAREFEKWQDEEKKAELIKHHRWASNNSIVIDEHNLSVIDWNNISNSIMRNGEPGFLNLHLMQNYGRLLDEQSDTATGTNPCGEVSLESFEPCNLAEIFPFNHGSLDETRRCLLHAYRYAKRVTLSDYAWEQTTEVVKRNRRIGVSISGFRDWSLVLQKQGNDLSGVLNILYDVVKHYDKSFSEELGINKSIKLTTVKPSGSISLLAGVSSGVHFHYAPYFIRRIQFQENDPMVQYCKELGFNVRQAVQYPKVMIVEFPIKAPTAELEGFKSEADATIDDQLEFQHLIQKHWADNQVSCTITFKQHEHQLIADRLQTYATTLKSTSMLPYFDLARDGGDKIKEQYPDLPNEPITKEEYERRCADIISWPQRLDKQDVKGLSVEVDECKGGHCPIK